MFIAKVTRQSIAALIVILFMVGGINAQDETAVYNIKLSDANVSTLTSIGSLRASIPADVRGKLAAIIIGTKANQDLDALPVDGRVAFLGDDAIVKMDDVLVREMNKQPIRVSVKDRDFSQVLINYAQSTETAQETAQAPQEDESEAPAIDPLPQTEQAKSFFINLNNNKTMEGQIDGFDQFSIKCKFGDVTMPLDQIAGIRFHTDSADSAVVVMKNGDSLTGVPIFEAVKIKTEWGQADIEPKHMKSITTTANASFSQGQTDFGSRWQLRTSIPSQNYNQPGQPYYGQ